MPQANPGEGDAPVLSWGAAQATLPDERFGMLQTNLQRALRFMLNYLNGNAGEFLQGLALRAQNRIEHADLLVAVNEWPIRRGRIAEAFVAAVLADLARRDAQHHTSGAQEPVRTSVPTLEPQGLGLVQHERLDESLTIENFATRALARHREVLAVLARCIMQHSSRRQLDAAALPFAPSALGRHFFAALDEAAVRPEARPAFVRLFVRFVLDELGAFYAECLSGMPALEKEPEPEPDVEADRGWTLQDPSASTSVEEEPAAPAPAPVAEPSDIAWDASHTPLLAAPGKAMALPYGLLDEILLELQRNPGKLGRSQATLNPKAGVLPLEIYELVNAALVDMGQKQPLALTLDMIEAVNLVRLLFERVLRDPRVAQPVRRVLRLLQIPLLRAALHDVEVLSLAEHPVRRFLGELVEAVIGWVPPADRANDALFRSMQQAVGRIITGYRSNTEVFAASLGEFRTAVRLHQTRARLLEHHALTAELGRLERDAARAAVEREIAVLPDDALLSRAVGDFLRGPFSDALFVIHLRHGTDDVQWHDALRTMDGLVAVACARPDADSEVVVAGLLQALRLFGLDDAAAAAQLHALEPVLGTALESVLDTALKPVLDTAL